MRRPRSRLASLVAVAAVPLLLAGCGSDETSPRDRLDRVADALQDVKSFHIEGTKTDDDGPQTLTGDIASDGRTSFVLTVKDVRTEFRTLGDDVYLRADPEFWDDRTPGLGARFGNRWVVVPAAASGIDKSIAEILPKTLGACLKKSKGDATYDGRQSLDGATVDVIGSPGKQPGTSPGKLYAATEGRPLPLRITVTGREKPGGTKDAECDSDDENTTTKSDLRFSRFDEPVTVTAPEGAIRVPTNSGGGQGSTT